MPYVWWFDEIKQSWKKLEWKERGPEVERDSGIRKQSKIAKGLDYIYYKQQSFVTVNLFARKFADILTIPNNIIRFNGLIWLEITIAWLCFGYIASNWFDMIWMFMTDDFKYYSIDSHWNILASSMAGRIRFFQSSWEFGYQWLVGIEMLPNTIGL